MFLGQTSRPSFLPHPLHIFMAIIFKLLVSFQVLIMQCALDFQRSFGPPKNVKVSTTAKGVSADKHKCRRGGWQGATGPLIRERPATFRQFPERTIRNSGNSSDCSPDCLTHSSRNVTVPINFKPPYSYTDN